MNPEQDVVQPKLSQALEPGFLIVPRSFEIFLGRRQKLSVILTKGEERKILSSEDFLFSPSDVRHAALMNEVE